ncbi:alpha/beta fold hydrolase [Brevundimonas sp. GCM10030266]|uniref:alpha/beta fold hydrolase n=1 Tax=Brevundimonas sp. GCM10030266 TaxID=3273386 RepID=UPI003608CA44
MTPTLLIPGLICTPELFSAQISALWTHGPVTVASTLEGETIADIAAAVLRDAPPTFALGGLSLGGYIALEIMRQAPDRVVKLGLLDTSARPDTPEQTAKRRGLISRAANGEYEAVVADLLPNLLHPDHRTDEGLINLMTRMGQVVGAEGFARQQGAIIGRIDSRPSLSAIAVPTLVLVGDQDGVTPPEHAREMADAIPGARLVIVPDAGHISTLEQPEAVNAALTDWLKA